MTPSEVRMIAFFYDKSIPRKGNDDDQDWLFIHNLDSKEVTYELTDPERERLFAIYDEHAPSDSADERHHVKNLIQTLKDVSTL